MLAWYAQNGIASKYSGQASMVAAKSSGGFI